MEIFRIQLIGKLNQLLSVELFDNFDSAKDYFDEIVQSLKDDHTCESFKLEFHKMDSCNNGRFLEEEWIDTY